METKEKKEEIKKNTDTKKGGEKVVHLLSEDVVDRLKEEYKSRIADKKIKRVLLDMDDMGKERLEVAILVPGRTTQDEFMKFIDRDPGKAQKLLVRNCLVTNIDQVNANDFLFSTCVSAIADLFTIGSYEIKNF